MYWVTKRMGYDYEIHYKKGNDNNGADALSRMPKNVVFQVSLHSHSDFLFLEIQKSWDDDVDLRVLKAHLQQHGGAEGKYSSDGQYLRKNGKLVVGNIPSVRHKILEWLHASSQGGRSAVQATYQRVKKLFWWRKLFQDIKDFVKYCDTCARCKSELVAYPGLLQPLLILCKVWESITVDFIEGLPKSNGKGTIWVIIDRCSKHAHFLPLSHPFTASTLAQGP